MRVGRKLGYAAAIAGGLLAATAWAAAAQNNCNSSFSNLAGLSFSNCDDPDPALAIAPEDACNNLYTQGYWSNPALAGGAGEHEAHEANLIRTGLRRDGWDTGVVGGINWEFDAATQEIPTPWGYEDPALLAQTIADYNALITNVQASLDVSGSDLAMIDFRAESQATLDTLNDLQTGGHSVPYYVDLPYWVDRSGATPPSFDPSNAAYQDVLDPLPKTLTADVGHFTTTPAWDPTLVPALEILKCEGWSATDFTASPRKYDNRGISCPTRNYGNPAWSSGTRQYNFGTCRYTRSGTTWVPNPNPPGGGSNVPWSQTEYEDWNCLRRTQSITIDGEPISRSLNGFRDEVSRNVWSCRYTFPRSVLNNFSSQLDQFDVNLGTSSAPAVTIGHDILADTFNDVSTPVGWAVRWTEHAGPYWPDGCLSLGLAHRFKPCWPTFDPDVRMSPRLDQLLVGTPTWVWMNNVLASCLPNATPAVPSPDCDIVAQARLWEPWPRDEGDPDMWRLKDHRRRLPLLTPGAYWRAVFPQKISIELTPTTPGAPVRPPYECWTDPTYQPGRIVPPGGVGAWAPGQRPFESGPGIPPAPPGTPTRPGPLATPMGPLNPGVGDCTFVHDVAGPHTATIRIHWIGKEGPSWPDNSVSWGDPPAGQEPAVTFQTVSVVFYELHTIPGP